MPIKKITALFLTLVLVFVGVNLKFASAAGAISFVDSDTNTTSGTSLTYSAVSLGAEAADRYIIVSAAQRNAGVSRPISSATIGGVAATIIAQDESLNAGIAGNGLGLIIALVPTGATGDIVINYSGGSVLRGSIGVWSATGITSTATDTATDVASPFTQDLDISANGIGVGSCVTGVTSATFTWSGLTEDYDTVGVTTNTQSGASLASASTQTISTTCTPSSVSNSVQVLASFPASASVTDTVNLETQGYLEVSGYLEIN